jgi:hypothetical protein
MLSHVRVLESTDDFVYTKDAIVILIKFLELLAQLLNFSFIHLASNVGEDNLFETVAGLEGLEGGEVEAQFLILAVLVKPGVVQHLLGIQPHFRLS